MKPKRNLTNTQLTELAMCLENDGDFYRSFAQIERASTAYVALKTAAYRLRSRREFCHGVEHSHERELLRAYLTEVWGIGQRLDDPERGSIAEKYKEFYGRDDDYDPDNVKVHKTSAMGSTSVTLSPPQDLQPGDMIVAGDQLWNKEPYTLPDAVIQRTVREGPDPVTVHICTPTGADSHIEGLFQLQGEIAGHMAKATFLLDKVEAALPDGIGITAATTGRWTCSEGETRTFCSAQPSLQQIPKTNPGNLPTTSEFNTMTNIITIRTVTSVSTNKADNHVTTFVNGTDVKNLTSAQIYGLISEAEDHVARLTRIQNKPLQLQAEIEANNAGIAALVAHLDERFKAENPDYVEAKAAKPRKARAAAPAPAAAENGATA